MTNWKIDADTLALLDTLDRERTAIVDTLNALHEKLDTQVTEMTDAYDNATERWRESARGNTVQDWLDSWGTFTDNVESAVSGLDDVETPPNDTPEFD